MRLLAYNKEKKIMCLANLSMIWANELGWNLSMIAVRMVKQYPMFVSENEPMTNKGGTS